MCTTVGGPDARGQGDIRNYTRKLAKALDVHGLVNIQFGVQRGKVLVIELNPRVSHTVPYVSEATGIPLAKIAARIMTGRKLKELLSSQWRTARTSIRARTTA